MEEPTIEEMTKQAWHCLQYDDDASALVSIEHAKILAIQEQTQAIREQTEVMLRFFDALRDSPALWK